MYPVTLPWIVYWAHILIKKSLPRWYASFLPWIPAVGMITWQRAILHLDLQYLAPSEGIVHPLKLMWQSQHNGWLLLLGGAVGTWFMHRRMSIILLLVATVNGITELAITQVLQSTRERLDAGWSMALWNRMCSMDAIGSFWHNINKRRTHTPYLLSTTLLMSLITLWMSGPFVSLLIWSPPLFNTQYCRSNIRTVSWYDSTHCKSYVARFCNTTNYTRQYSTPQTSWWCRRDAKPNWESQQRAFAGIEYHRSLHSRDLQPHLFEIFQRGITHIGLLTVSTHTHWYPPLAKHLQYPVLHWYMTPPPSTARLAVLNTTGSIEWVRDGDEHCAITLSWENTIQEAADAYHSLIQDHQCTSQVFLSMPRISS